MSYCHRPSSYHLVREKTVSVSPAKLMHSPAKLAQDLGAWGMPTFLISLGISIFEKESIIRHLLKDQARNKGNDGIRLIWEEGRKHKYQSG